MEVRIKAIHFDASQKLVDFINRKAERFERRNTEVTYLDVTLKLTKPETAMNKEVVLMAGDKVVSKTADTFENAFDAALEVMDRQLAKTKD